MTNDTIRCIGVCRLEKNVCIGCGRTSEEITEAGKRAAASVTVAIEDPDGTLHGNGDIVASADAYRNPLSTH